MAGAQIVLSAGCRWAVGGGSGGWAGGDDRGRDDGEPGLKSMDVVVGGAGDFLRPSTIVKSRSDDRSGTVKSPAVDLIHLKSTLLSI